MTPFPLEELVPWREPDRPAILVAEGETWSRGRLRAERHGWRGRLGSLGLPPGAVVALWGSNSPRWIAAALGAWAQGLVVLPLSPRWTDAEVRGVLTRVPVSLLVGDRPLVARARSLGLQASCLDEPTDGWDLEATSPGPLPADRLAALVPTSGTTGTPKLAMLTAEGLGTTAALTADALGLRPGDVYWLPMPLAHVGGLGAVCRALGAGAAVALPGPDAHTLTAWQTCGVTHASVVPTQLLDLTASGAAAWPARLRVVLVGGAAPPPDLAARCPAAWATYGLTEAGGTVTLGPADRAGTSGPPLAGWTIRVVDGIGRLVPAGEAGEVELRGPGLMAGYWQDAEATAAALREGWLRTGDLGTVDAAGRLTLHARRTDLIVSGGANVYPAEVEGALLAHPAIREAAVLGEPDPRWGQRVVACVVLRDVVASLSLEALRTDLATRLAGYKHPRRLVA
ncbi:MAG: AMP-binding protein, partial [Candidatus Sericytochromatia bacterium]|nr:AMP-binding protein [Candidatus Sericytochromatia bacterium]